MAQMIYKVEAFWDVEAAVWVATSEDIPGLVTEAETIEALMQKLRSIVLELILLNRLVTPDTDSIELQLTSHRQELIEVAS
ncbi:DUF1902 domain-containing protein [Gloeocapsopsis sp. IPPAS B-1203]|uniref:DUF1902 domain-containing protein n=1 Tax=Gloeocapsopsis sp. IPPAS B-1203 TaxID=2049454 RepID=UPI000C191BAD|nr:DUF1902 domain-containing protein [Gloeocapsopsis sp. IPPAS B-1203]PIG93586.1 hypothetical protein CSQ79_10835 [Gloeocapsopsis sp. IPPAS B-1203]